MYFQDEFLRESDTMTRNSTYRILLPEQGLLSSLLLRLQANCTSGATLADPLWRIQDHISLIEVIGNGATVIKSFTFKHAAFLNWLHQGVVPPANWRNYATNTQREYVQLLFGNKHKSLTHGLDLGKWDSVELRVTNTATATYYGTDFTITSLGTYLRDASGFPGGYIRSELWRQWTTVVGQTVYTILPSEFPISVIGLRALPHATNGLSDDNFYDLMDDVDFSIAGGTKRVFKGHMSSLNALRYLDCGYPVLTSGLVDATADRGVDFGIGASFGWATTPSSKDGTVSTNVGTEVSDATTSTVSFEARQADHPVEFIHMGMGFQNTVPLVDVEDLNPDLMVDPKRDGECRLNIQTLATSTAGGTNEIILERVVA